MKILSQSDRIDWRISSFIVHVVSHRVSKVSWWRQLVGSVISWWSTNDLRDPIDGSSTSHFDGGWRGHVHCHLLRLAMDDPIVLVLVSSGIYFASASEFDSDALSSLGYCGG